MGVIAKQSIQGTIATYIGAGISIITTFFVMTRFLTAEEIGLQRVLVDVGTAFIGLAQLGTSSSIIRFYPYFRTEDRRDHGFFFWTLLIPLIGFIIVALLFWLLRDPIASKFQEKSALFVNYYFYILPLAFFMLYQTVFETNSNVRMRIVFPRTVREVIIRLLLLVQYLLYAFHIISLDGFVISLCAIYGIAALLNLIYLFATGNVSLRPDILFLKENQQLIRRYLFYTGFLILSALATVFAPVISGLFVASKIGLDYGGIFTIAVNMAALVCIPSRSMNAIVSPEISQSFKTDDKEQLSQLLKQVSSTLFFIGCLLMLIIWVNIDLIFYILPNGEIYATARETVLLLSVGQILVAAFTIATYAINYSRFYYFSLICSALLTICLVVLNKMFIPTLGINGAALANCLSYLLFFLLVLAVVRIFLHTTPLSVSHLKSLLLTVIVFAINETIMHIFPEMNIWLSSILRSLVLIGGFATVAWYWNISPEIKSYIRNMFRKS